MLSKPRIRLCKKIWFITDTWVCYIKEPIVCAVFGTGYTPKEAYDTWLESYKKSLFYKGRQ